VAINAKYRERLKELLRRKSLKRGTFTLSSGRKSDYYLDCKLTTLDPEGSVLTGYTVLELLESHGIHPDAIGGPTMGADPIVSAVAAVSYLEGKPVPAFLIRKERKAHGREKRVEGIELKPGSQVVIVDDVCTTGGATIEAIAAAEDAGLVVTAVLSLVDREEGGSDQIRQRYAYYPVFTAGELLGDDSHVEPRSNTFSPPIHSDTAPQKRSVMPVDAKDRLIVALDCDSMSQAEALVEGLEGLVSFFKVGIELQLSEGMSPVKYLISKGKKIFLDLKYFDVSETVERAVRRAASLGVYFLTIHGNARNIEAAVKGRGDADLKLLSVTVLTSLDACDIRDLGFQCSVEELVLHRAKKGLEAGCDGVIASGQEAGRIRSVLGDKLLIVTPGIRPVGFPKQDQKRAVTPQEAILQGADYLVVGRAITADPSPRKAAENVIRDMEEAFASIA